MQDRISNHPNRWVLTPVTGETNTYDFTRADDPTQAGTPLNKATFLPDTVAAAVEAATGASGITLPCEALDALAGALDTIGLTYNAKVATFSWTGTGGTGGRSVTAPFQLRFLFALRTDAMTISSDESLFWIYGVAGKTTSGAKRYYTLSDSDTKLTWKSNQTSDKDVVTLNVSGVSYVAFAVGVK